MNGTCRGGEDDCLDCPVMSQLRAWTGTGRGGEDDYLHDSVEGLGWYMQRTKDNCLDGVVDGSGRGDLLDGPAMTQLRAFNGTC